MAGIELAKKKKIAFVCSGGAVKAAAFHVGVALALEQRGFDFLGGTRESQSPAQTPDPSKTIQTYVGSSAGSLVTTFLAQGGKLKNLVASFQTQPDDEGIPGLKYWQMLFPRMRKPLDWLGSGPMILQMLKNRSFQSLFSTEGITRYMREHLITTENFSELEAELFIVATEVNRTRKAVFGRYRSVAQDPQVEWRNDVSVSDACAASMSVPLLYHPYRIAIEGRPRDYYDGEIIEPLSVHIARETGCDLVICSYTHQPVRVMGASTLADNGVDQVVLQALYQSIENKIRAARSGRQKEKALLDRIRKFFREKNLGSDLCEQLCEEVEARLTYKSNVDYIYIHPRSSDLDMFLLPHFSLNKEKTERIVKKGFASARAALRGLEHPSF